MLASSRCCALCDSCHVLRPTSTRLLKQQPFYLSVTLMEASLGVFCRIPMSGAQDRRVLRTQTLVRLLAIPRWRRDQKQRAQRSPRRSELCSTSALAIRTSEQGNDRPERWPQHRSSLPTSVIVMKRTVRAHHTTRGRRVTHEASASGLRSGLRCFKGWIADICVLYTCVKVAFLLEGYFDRLLLTGTYLCACSQ